jgi:hypothetical protein
MRDREWQDWSTFEKMEWLKKQFEALEGWLCSLDEKMSRDEKNDSAHFTEDGRCVVNANDWDHLHAIKDSATELCHIALKQLPLPADTFNALMSLMTAIGRNA